MFIFLQSTFKKYYFDLTKATHATNGNTELYIHDRHEEIINLHIIMLTLPPQAGDIVILMCIKHNIT